MKTSTQRTKNLVEVSAIYDPGLALWWSENEIMPSCTETQDFFVNRKVWKEFIENYVETIIVESVFNQQEKAIKGQTFTGKFLKSTKDLTISSIIYWEESVVNKDKLLISNLKFYFDYLHPLAPTGKAIEDLINPMKIESKSESHVYMVIQDGGDLDLHPFKIDVPDIDIKMNYGEEWESKHKDLIDILSMKKKKGIALLHGLPGTGKSMYIRHLISILSENRPVVYLPNQLISMITDPAFIPLMAEYTGALLIIEDADEAIRSRKTGGGTVDKLLNLADGILSDFLNMQIICTFNSDVSSIDDALLRKGRLILKHKFDKLSVENSQKLSDKLGFKTQITSPMTLAEIYNQDDKLNIENQETKKIGFK